MLSATNSFDNTNAREAAIDSTGRLIVAILEGTLRRLMAVLRSVSHRGLGT